MKRLIVLSSLCLLSACTAPATTPDPNASASTSPSTSTNPDASTTPVGEFKYLGRTADKVSPAFSGGPDGTLDYVFSYSHDFGKEVTLKSVIVSRIENGKPLGFAGWTTAPGNRYWVINVNANGTDLNGGSPTEPLGKITGKVDFVLTGASTDASLFTPGTVYELMLTYEDSGDQVLTAQVTL